MGPKRRKIDLVAKAIRHGDISTISDEPVTLAHLRLAVRLGNIQIVESVALLVNPLDQPTGRAFEEACKCGQYEIAYWLSELTTENWLAVGFRRACAGNRMDLVRHLYTASRASSGGNYALKVAAKKGYNELVEYLLQQNHIYVAANDCSAMLMALENKHNDIFLRLMKRCSKWDVILRFAARKLSVRPIIYLIGMIDIYSPPVRLHDALIEACRFNNTPVVRYLVNDPRINNCRAIQMALFTALSGNFDKSAYILLDHGAFIPTHLPDQIYDRNMAFLLIGHNASFPGKCRYITKFGWVSDRSAFPYLSRDIRSSIITLLRCMRRYADYFSIYKDLGGRLVDELIKVSIVL